MDNINVLLSDEFVAFSNKIAGILGEKKKKKMELKAFFDKIQAELAVLDDQAKAASIEFDEWKKEKVKEDKQEETQSVAATLASVGKPSPTQ